MPIQYFMPNAVLFTSCGIPPAILLIDRLHDGRPGAAVGRARTGCAGMGAALGVDLHVLHRRHRRRAARRRSSPTPAARGPPCSCSCVPSTIIGGLPDPARRDVHQERPVAGRRRAARGARRAPSASRSIPSTSPRSRSTTSTSPTARCRCCSTSASRCRRARCSRCSAPTARASRRSCGPSPGSAPRRAASSACTATPITYIAPEQRVKLGIRLLPGRQGRVPAR